MQGVTITDTRHLDDVIKEIAPSVLVSHIMKEIEKRGASELAITVAISNVVMQGRNELLLIKKLDVLLNNKKKEEQ